MTPQSELGEDVVPVPPPLTERPEADRYCDLVLTGGVASGVVYPWAMLELARRFHFKNIGGTSVGAMAAALAAAAEYGRRTGKARQSFEVLRRLPGALAFELPEGRTRLLSLFQPSPQGRRLFGLFVAIVKLFGVPSRDWDAPAPAEPGRRKRRDLSVVLAVVRAYRRELLRVFSLVLLIGADWLLLTWPTTSVLAVGLAVLGWSIVFGAVELWLALHRDFKQGIVDHKLGLCAGATVETAPDRPALTQWLHDGIQQAAGLQQHDAPLTFRDLWNAPDHAGAAPRERPVDSRSSADDRSINLEMVTSNVTHGRPYRLPLVAETTRLFFRREDLTAFFPTEVLDALERHAKPYVQLSASDPKPEEATKLGGLLELPGADLPVVVAARMSLSFPILLAAVPLYAIDSEMERPLRDFKRCWFSDGGLCSNFPVHLFDESVPRWPTFGMWLGKRSPYRADQPVWLPPNHLDGRGETWQRFDPDDPMTNRYTGEPEQRPSDFLGGFLLACLSTAKDWGDRATMRMPHMRKRVARLGLVPGEGELNIAMKRATILEMAHKYGTAAGREFVQRYADAPGGATTADWREQRWVRWQTLILTVRKMLAGFSVSADSRLYSVPLDQAIHEALAVPPLQGKVGDADRMAVTLTPQQAEALTDALAALR